MTQKKAYQKPRLLIYSFGLSLPFQFVMGWFGVLYSRVVNDLSPSEFPLTEVFDPAMRTAWLLSIVQTTVTIFLYWLFVRWTASTAEKAGRSYVAFMLLAMFLPVVAWIIVIMFKKPNANEKPHETV